MGTSKKTKPSRILILGYYSYKDPLFTSAVLRYFEALPKLPGRQFFLLTFESSTYPLHQSDIPAIESYLRDQGIVWYRFSWNSGRFKWIKKAFDLSSVLFRGSYIVLKHGINTIYSEGFPGAILGHSLSRLTGCSHIVHTFEPHAGYMVEAGVWQEKSWEAVLLQKMERRVALRAKHIITATTGYAEIISSWQTRANIHVIPSCVDTKRFCLSADKRSQIRAKEGVSDHETIFVYTGKLGGMYMDDEIFQFFSQCNQIAKSSFRFWIITGEKKEVVDTMFERRGLPKNKTLVIRLEASEVPDYLNAADIGVVAIRPVPSKKYSSPIKTGEYWACGLPVITPPGISDDSEAIRNNPDLGIVVNDFTHPSKNDLFKIATMVSDITEDQKERISKHAIAARSIDAFIGEFNEVLS